MSDALTRLILRATGAERLELSEVLQELWSGYGTIRRYRLHGCHRPSVVVKHVRFPEQSDHPRGWNTALSHQRKLRSYRVETSWYAHWSKRCSDACRVPQCLAIETYGDETLMVLEDLDAAGFPNRKESLSERELLACLSWLANFHATFIACTPHGLWPQGTYWHLATRPDELAALDDLPLKRAAAEIDRQLRTCRYRTLVHGDAKLANFCFAPDGEQVAAVDFQYVGGGCGMQDLAYFLGSCLEEDECRRQEAWLLERYFEQLQHALAKQQPGIDGAALEAEWRQLFPLAWCDFHRFLKGWSPGHWKLNSYSEEVARGVINRLGF